MKMSVQFLKKIGACKESIDCYKENKEPKTLKKVFKLLLDKNNNYKWQGYNRLEWANWFICRIFDKKQKVQYAVYAAKQVIKIFEEKYPNDDRPRKAIKAAEKYIKCMNEENRKAAYAAAAAAYAAADAADDADAAYAAAAAAYAAADAADADAYAAYAADAADVAYTAAYAAAYAAKNKLRLKILKYGLKLLGIDIKK
jgi:hypothetical protein